MKTILLSAVSVDGKIARDSSDKLDWVSKENKQFFAKVTKKAGVVIVGHNTFRVIGKPLPGRLLVVLASKPWEEETIQGKVEFTNNAPLKILKDLESRRFKQVFIGGGRKVNTLFLKGDLIEEVWLVVEPIILGQGIGLFEEEEFNLSCSLLSLTKITEHILLVKYKLQYRN